MPPWVLRVARRHHRDIVIEDDDSMPPWVRRLDDPLGGQGALWVLNTHSLTCPIMIHRDDDISSFEPVISVTMSFNDLGERIGFIYD